MIGLREDAALAAALKNYLNKVLIQARFGKQIHPTPVDNTLRTKYAYRSMVRTHYLRVE